VEDILALHIKIHDVTHKKVYIRYTRYCTKLNNYVI